MKKEVCKQCDGNGWYADHSPEHYHYSHDTDCSKYGCPVQVECDLCEGTGYKILNVEKNARNKVKCE